MESWLEGCQRKQLQTPCLAHPAKQLSHEASSSDLCILADEGGLHTGSTMTIIIEAAYVAHELRSIQSAL